MNKRKIVIINVYNPCRRIRIKELERFELGNKAIWCDDFNAHNILWGGKTTDNNGQTIEELIVVKGLVC